jgi:hypothetical protein
MKLWNAATPYYMVKDEGVYNIIFDVQIGEQSSYLKVPIYRRGKNLFFINPETKKEMCVKGLMGWSFEKCIK